MSENERQETMWDLESREFNPDWVDDKQPLKVPKRPLHFKAHKLQLLIERLEIQAKRNPAQFNSRTYIDALNEFNACAQKINEGLDDEESVDTRGVAENRDEEAAAGVGEAAAVSVDSRISADNPLSG